MRASAGKYGLSAAVFTNDLDRALQAVDRLPVGQLHINSETAGADPHVPFGGVRESGLGPKEQGETAREFYSTTTTVYLRGGARPARWTASPSSTSPASSPVPTRRCCSVISAPM